MGGTRETMDNGTTGLLVPPKDVQALIGALGELLGDPSRRATMGEAARAWLRRQFTLDEMISQVSATYEEALSMRPGAP
jgi:glycosyltransferase involved in cell wall biosynthesis